MVKNLWNDKRAILLVSLIALISLVVLASAIKGTDFRPTQHFSREETEMAQRSPLGEIAQEIMEVPLEKQIAFLVMIFLFGVLVASMLSPEMRKKLLRQLFRLFLSIVLILYLLKIKPDIFDGLLPFFALNANGQATPSPEEAAPPLPVFEPPQVSAGFSFIVTLALVLLGALFFWRLSRWWTSQREVRSASLPLDRIAEVARASLRELSLGNASAHEAIIQCYERMSHVVDERRGLARDSAMTPSEFASRLEKAGLPRGPVNRLTKLFESVRYGGRISSQADVSEAISCLTSIVEYCGESA